MGFSLLGKFIKSTLFDAPRLTYGLATTNYAILNVMTYLILQVIQLQANEIGQDFSDDKVC
jgi:hypothetical protein